MYICLKENLVQLSMNHLLRHWAESLSPASYTARARFNIRLPRLPPGDQHANPSCASR